MEDYWKTYQIQSLLYEHTSKVSLVRFTSSLTVNSSHLGVVKSTPLSADIKREAAVHHTLSYMFLGVLPLRHMFEHQGHLVQVMDYASRGSLQHLINSRSTPLPRDQYLHLLHSLIKVLYELHQHNWTHGSISPENFVLCDDGEWKAIDFGQARRVQTDSEDLIGFKDNPNSLFWKDIWWLGWTCLWAGTRNDSLQRKPTPGQHWLLDKYVERELSSQYDSDVVWVVQQLLCVNESDRSSLRYLLEVTARLLNATQPLPDSTLTFCPVCQAEVPSPAFTQELRCGHVMCFGCYQDTVTTALMQKTGIASIPCPTCRRPLDVDLVLSYRNALKREIRELLSIQYYLSITTSCHNQHCAGSFPIYKEENTRLKSYNARCPKCGEVCCSYCKLPKGHHRNGFSAPCPSFRPDALHSIFHNAQVSQTAYATSGLADNTG